MKFLEERAAFDRLKNDISPQAKQEYERVFNTLIERYNTAIYENRFIAGGAVEIFTCALLRTVGVDCNLCGSQAKRGDIILPSDKMLSVKGVFTGGAEKCKINK